jgi:hypothetical protein
MDVRHNFVFSGLYRLPFGTGQQFFSNWGTTTNLLLGGWQLNAVYNMRTGTPVNVVTGNNPTAALPGLRPNRIGNPNIPRDQRTLLKYYDTAAFAPVCAPGDQNCNPNTPGDAGRNIVRGPGFINLDSSLFKDFGFKDRYHFQLRLEAFNTLNTPHFANPDGSLASATAGQISSTIGIAASLSFNLCPRGAFYQAAGTLPVPMHARLMPRIRVYFLFAACATALSAPAGSGSTSHVLCGLQPHGCRVWKLAGLRLE